MTAGSDAQTLAECAVDILATADPADKLAMTDRAAAAWRQGQMSLGGAMPPERPARSARPRLAQPWEMPRRSTGPKGRIALVHALAHIELNAVDLAWDIIARFTNNALPRRFYDDWVDIAVEEAAHHDALARRLESLGAAYGDLPAHDGLWDAAVRSADDLAARLVLIPMTLEARGLDTTPPTVQRLRRAGDEETAAILEVIFADEIKHLAVGLRWFEFLCAARNLCPHSTYREILDARFPGGLKAPFNLEARGAAGMGEPYMRPWL